MTRRAMFIAVTFLLGWMFQSVFLYVVPVALPTPHWLLLAVLAIGSAGRTEAAQGLGFFWGLSLDVYGITAFGAQGWLLALAGFASGSLAKKLDTEKMETQQALALGGTLLYLLGASRLIAVFQPAAGPRDVAWGLVAGEIFLNALAAPAVFWAVRRWLAWGDRWAGTGAPHG